VKKITKLLYTPERRQPKSRGNRAGGVQRMVGKHNHTIPWHMQTADQRHEWSWFRTSLPQVVSGSPDWRGWGFNSGLLKVLWW